MPQSWEKYCSQELDYTSTLTKNLEFIIVETLGEKHSHNDLLSLSHLLRLYASLIINENAKHACNYVLMNQYYPNSPHLEDPLP